MLLHEVPVTDLENRYAHAVTRFGKNQTLNFIYEVNLCTATDLTFDYSKGISFTSACKQANFQNG